MSVGLTQIRRFLSPAPEKSKLDPIIIYMTMQKKSAPKDQNEEILTPSLTKRTQSTPLTNVELKAPFPLLRPSTYSRPLPFPTNTR